MMTQTAHEYLQDELFPGGRDNAGLRGTEENARETDDMDDEDEDEDVADTDTETDTDTPDLDEADLDENDMTVEEADEVEWDEPMNPPDTAGE